jgi:hypothetical protein
MHKKIHEVDQETGCVCVCALMMGLFNPYIVYKKLNSDT